jgi:hypothetical protein
LPLTKGEEGYYALCDGSKLRDPLNKCILSKTIDINSLSDFQFWYYMWGGNVGTFELIADSNVIWTLTGKQSNSWLLAEVQLPPGNYLVITKLFFIQSKCFFK